MEEIKGHEVKRVTDDKYFPSALDDAEALLLCVDCRTAMLPSEKEYFDDVDCGRRAEVVDGL